MEVTTLGVSSITSISIARADFFFPSSSSSLFLYLSLFFLWLRPSGSGLSLCHAFSESTNQTLRWRSLPSVDLPHLTLWSFMD